MKSIKTLPLVIFIIVNSVIADELTSPLSATQSIEQGLKFFKNKQYLSARNAFMQAESEIYYDSSLAYNLGVVNYKLGFYPTAEKYFLELTSDTKYQALAFYNLALIGFKMEQNELATAWLEQCIATSKTDSLTLLAQGLLQKSDDTNQQMVSAVKQKIRLSEFENTPGKVKTFVKYLTGYDDNVTQYLAYTKQKIADNFNDVQLDATVSPYRGVAVQSSMYFHLYNNITNYNTSEFSLAANYSNHIRRLHYVLRSELRKQLFNNKEFQQLSDNGVDLSFPITQQLHAISSYNLQLVRVENPAYEHLAGHVNQWQQQLEYRSNSFRYTLSYSYERNNRRDHYIYNNILASSYSPLTHAFESNIVYSGKKINMDLYGKFALSNYPDKNILYPGAINQISVYQQSNLLGYGFRVSMKLNKNLYAIARYYYERNFSNLTLYRYEKNIYLAGISWQF